MVLDRFRRKKKQVPPAVTKTEFLKIKPVRNPLLRWEKTEGSVRIFIPLQQPEPEKKKKPKKKKEIGLLSKLSPPPPPSEKKIDLDKIGSLVWEQCDGEKTMADIANYLQKKFKMMPSEAEIALNSYFNQLSKRGLVGFVLPEETRARFEEIAKAEKEKK